MRTAAQRARLVPVTDADDEMDRAARGAEIKRRRLAYGIRSVRAFADGSGVDRQAIAKAEAGEGSPGTLDRLEAWLNNEFNSGEPDEASTEDVRPADLMELELTVDAVGLHIIGKGTAANMDEVRRQIADLYREIRSKDE